MAGQLSFDINSEKWLSIWRLNNLENPDYYETLRKWFNSLAMSMNEEQLIKELDYIIADRLESPMGNTWEVILFTYKNLPALNSFTKSNNPNYGSEYVRKYELKRILGEIEDWIFKKLVLLEPNIRFQNRQQIM